MVFKSAVFVLVLKYKTFQKQTEYKGKSKTQLRRAGARMYLNLSAFKWNKIHFTFLSWLN